MKKKRLGLLLPSSNIIMEQDLFQGLNGAASLHTARMHLCDTNADGEAQMLDKYFPLALRDLITTEPDAIIFGCTSAGALRGNAYERELCRRIEEASGRQAISVIVSARRIIAAAGCSRLAILTPYVAELNQRIQSSFEEDGFQVVLIKGMGILRNLDIGLVTPDKIAAFAREALQDVHADALFLSCTNFRAMEARKQLMSLGIPIFTSNQATLQAVRQIMG